MEAAPTFTLPNQFLVWVAKKVFAQCDLDLVLTEYYKKRLESRLKNREKHANESTNSTKLQIPIDWISCIKLSSTRTISFPPSPPLFSLSLSPNIALLFSTTSIDSPSLSQHCFDSPPLRRLGTGSLIPKMADTTEDRKMT